MKSLSIFTTLLIICNYHSTAQDFPDPEENVRIYFYYYRNGNGQNVSYQLKDANNLLKHDSFHIHKNTTLFAPGYTEYQTNGSVEVLRKAYSHRKEFNFVSIDYLTYANRKYIPAVYAVQYIAPYIARAIIKLFNAGLPIEKFHLVGHSLGGQLVGVIGRNIIKESNGTKVIKRISALDPAGPLFYIIKLIKPISKEDADFVDIIHTDAGLNGAPVSTGSLDFWPNGGHTTQPGCPDFLQLTDITTLCSHRKSYRFWGESVSNLYPEKFVAYKDTSFSNFLLTSPHCNSSDEMALMGLQASPKWKGNYYLKTNPDPPYAQTICPKEN